MPLGDSGPGVATHSHTHTHTHTHTHSVLGGLVKPLKHKLEQDAIQGLSNETDTDKSVLGGLAAPLRHEN